MTVHTVFSTDGSVYQQWQSDVLAHSYRKVRQPGPLTRLYSAPHPPPPFDGRTFATPPFSPHPLTNDDYLPYNKAGAVAAWLTEAPPAEETLLFIDPDCIFVTACDEEVERGRPVAHPFLSMDVTSAEHPELLRRHGFEPGTVQGMGIPILIHRDDLSELSPLYVQKTEEIRDDPASREVAGWMSEMWGYAFAAAQLGLRHELRRMARWPMDPAPDLPFIHYTFSSESRQEPWKWYKSMYRPWERLPPPPSDVPPPTVMLFALINELAEQKGHHAMMTGHP